MKKVGIVGGLGPVSSMDFYSGIIHGVRTKTGDDRNTANETLKVIRKMGFRIEK